MSISSRRVAPLTSRLFEAGAQVHILATSREALRVDGEHVFVLAPLPCPPDDPSAHGRRGRNLSRRTAVPRARTSQRRATWTSTTRKPRSSRTSVASSTASRWPSSSRPGAFQTYGLRKTAELLDERLTLLWPGRRTAPPRQRTLQATLDWSYELLTDTERLVLRRLAVFVGSFTFEAGAAGREEREPWTSGPIYRAIESLIDKSLVSSQPLGAMMRYRLLDSTRAYALQAHVRGSRHRCNFRPACRPTSGVGWNNLGAGSAERFESR